MATVNVTTANTFEEWRVKTNELGTAVGNLTNLTEPLAGATDIVAALGDHETRTEAIDLIIGTDALWDTSNYGTLRKAANKNHADIATLAATAGIDLATNSLSGYDGDETTLVAILDAQYAFDGGKAGATNMTTTAQTLAPAIEEVHGEVTTATTNIGTIGSLATSASNLVAAVNEVHTETNTNTTNIAAIGTTYVAVAGDTMTGTLVTPSYGLSGSTAGVSAATLLTFGTGSGTAIKIDSNQRIGIGTTAHASHKVDISGNLNATKLFYGGTDLESKFFTQGEVFEDAVGAMITGSTQTGGITASYDDTNGEIDFAIGDNGHAHTTGNVTGLVEFIQDTVGDMVTTPGNTETGIDVTYQDVDGTLDFQLANDPTLTFTGDVVGSGVMTDLGSVSIELLRTEGSTTTADIADDAITYDKLENVQSLIIYSSAPATATAAVNGALSSSTTLVVDGNSGTIAVGMIVSGTGVSGEPSVVTVTSQNNLVLSHAQTIANNAALTFTQSLKILRAVGDA